MAQISWLFLSYLSFDLVIAYGVSRDHLSSFWWKTFSASKETFAQSLRPEQVAMHSQKGHIDACDNLLAL